VFYGENSAGVSGDVYTATAMAASMVGTWAMGPDPVALGIAAGPKPGRQDTEETEQEIVLRRLERIGGRIMNRASGGQFADNPVGAVLGDPHKRASAAQLLGQAYVTAYALMAANRAAIERIADALIEEKEIYGDDVIVLLDGVGLVRPELDLTDDSTWPTV
jgi:ATP-dependent Zn protease